MFNNIFTQILYYECCQAWRARLDLAKPLIFYLLIVTLFPLGLTTSSKILAQLAPGIIYTAVLLAQLISLQRFLIDDYADGSLEQLLLSDEPLSLLLLAKIAAHWLLTSLPLVLVTPLIAVILAMPIANLVSVLLGLLITSAIFLLIGGLVTAIIIGLQQQGMLLALLIIPIFTPIFLLGIMAATTSTLALLLLLAILCLLLPLIPLIMAWMLRIGYA